MKDYEVLRKELAGDNEVLESLQRAQTRLKKSLGEVHNTNFGGEVEELSSLDKFKAAISSPGEYLVPLQYIFVICMVIVWPSMIFSSFLSYTSNPDL